MVVVKKRECHCNHATKNYSTSHFNQSVYYTHTTQNYKCYCTKLHTVPQKSAQIMLHKVTFHGTLNYGQSYVHTRYIQATYAMQYTIIYVPYFL